MASAYQGSLGGGVGTLLRLIKEDQSQNVVTKPPATESGSPIRELQQEPVLQPESPETSRQVSLRPEGGVVGPVAPASQPEGLAGGEGVTPIVPGLAQPGGGIGPEGPQVVAPRPFEPPTPSGGGGNNGGGGGQPQPQPQQSRPASPSIATSIRPSATGVPAYSDISSGSRGNSYTPTSSFYNTPSTSKPYSPFMGNEPVGGGGGLSGLAGSLLRGAARLPKFPLVIPTSVFNPWFPSKGQRA